MAVLTSGRTELSCYDSIGGIRNVYFFKYEDYPYNQIVGTRGVELTSFPTTVIYKYEVNGGTFNEPWSNDENGVLYNQTLSFTLRQQNVLTTNELDLLTKIDLRYIVEFNNGDFKIGGLFNGASITGLELVSGGGKADLTGYNITIESKEEWQSAYVGNLIDIVFIIYNCDNYLFQDLNNFIFQDGNNYIFNSCDGFDEDLFLFENGNSFIFENDDNLIYD